MYLKFRAAYGQVTASPKEKSNVLLSLYATTWNAFSQRESCKENQLLILSESV